MYVCVYVHTPYIYAYLHRYIDMHTFYLEMITLHEVYPAIFLGITCTNKITAIVIPDKLDVSLLFNCSPNTREKAKRGAAVNELITSCRW